MQCYKKIDLGNTDEIKRRCLDLFPEERKHKTSLFYLKNNKELFLQIPALSRELDRLNLTKHIYAIGFYIVFAGSPLTIHKDNGEIIYSLNIPLSGCANTYVNFYDTASEPTEKLTKAGNKYFEYDENLCNLVDRLELTSPHIINVKIPHAVLNNNDNPRITMLIRLNSEIGKLF